MTVREFIEKIGNNRNIEDMTKLGEMLEDVLYEIKEQDPDEFQKYKMKLYEMAYGKKINEEMADDWVKSMQPVGLHWIMEETTGAMRKLGYNFDNIDFYVVANMMYNDYYDLVKEDETLVLKLAKDWLDDEDSAENKLYNYWKYIIKK